MQNFVYQECSETTEAIQAKIRSDQARLNVKMIKQLKILKNHMACAMKDDPQVKRTLIDEVTDKIQAVEQDKDNSEIIANAPAESVDINEMYDDAAYGQDDAYGQ